MMQIPDLQGDLLIGIDQTRRGLIRTKYHLTFRFSSGKSISLIPNLTKALRLIVNEKPHGSDLLTDDSKTLYDTHEEQEYYLDVKDRWQELIVQSSLVSSDLVASGRLSSRMLDKYLENRTLFGPWVWNQLSIRTHRQSTAQTKGKEPIIGFMVIPVFMQMTMWSMQRQATGLTSSGFRLSEGLT